MANKVSDIQTRLSAYLREKARWRAQKAEEYPEDDRNSRSAEGIKFLANWISNLPPDEPRLVMLSALDADDDTIPYSPGEESDRLASRYLFDVPKEKPDAWLERFVEACTRDWPEFVESGDDDEGVF